jgi:hypothetical protein
MTITNWTTSRVFPKSGLIAVLVLDAYRAGDENGSQQALAKVHR